MKFQLISLIFLLLICSCSRKTDKQLYQEGVAAEVQNNFQSAAGSYEQAVADHPGTAYAESSLARLGPLYTNELKDPQKAVGAYERYYKMFPGSKESPTMLFLAGFVYNNDLHQTDSARARYQEYLNRYPDGQLAQSAKFELQNLGKDADQVLGSQVSQGASDQPESPADEPERKSGK